MKKIFTVLTLLLLIGAGIVIINKKKAELESLPTTKAKLVSVEVADPKERLVEQRRVFVGRYYSDLHPKISSKLSGFVKKLFVTEGASIKKGEPLVEIDDRELKEAIKSQEASIKALQYSLESIKDTLFALKSDYLYAKEVYERNRALYEAGALPKEKLDQSKVIVDSKLAKLKSTKKNIEAKTKEIEAMRAALRSKKEQLRYTLITAPINGIVGKLYLKEGDLAVPGKPILELLGDKKKVEFVFEPTLEIKQGMKAYVEGKESFISKILPDSQNSLSVARIELKPLNLPENANVKVEVVQKSVKGVSVPVNAILEKYDENYVFIYRNGRFHPKKIKILAKNESYAVISSDIKEPVAIGSNDKLSRLFFLNEVKAIRNE